MSRMHGTFVPRCGAHPDRGCGRGMDHVEDAEDRNGYCRKDRKKTQKAGKAGNEPSQHPIGSVFCVLCVFCGWIPRRSPRLRVRQKELAAGNVSRRGEAVWGVRRSFGPQDATRWMDFLGFPAVSGGESARMEMLEAITNYVYIGSSPSMAMRLAEVVWKGV